MYIFKKKRQQAPHLIEKRPFTESDRLLEKEEEIKELCNDINHINQICRNLSTIVKEQTEPLEKISYNTFEALDRTKKGVKNIEIAKKYQPNYLKLTLIGGIVGCSIGGPFGAIIGLKWMSLITAGGGGLIGGLIPNLIN